MSRLLIVVDMQNDFVDGALGFEGAETIIPKIISRISEYEEAGDDIVYTLDTHGEDYMQTQEGRKLPVPHCIKGQKGHELVPALKSILEGKRAFEKPVFGSLELGNFIAENRGKYETIEVCGLVSNICVISNAVIARAGDPEAEIVVDRELTASFDQKLNDETMDVLAGFQVKVTGA